jgi:lysophospholipase L1-like esterase
MGFAKNLLVVLISTAFGLICCEMTLRIFFPQDLSGTWLVDAATGDYQLNKSNGEVRHQIGNRVVHYRFFPPHLRDTPLISDGSRRVLFLGDSFTFGWLLDFPSTYIGQIQRFTDEAFGSGRFQMLDGGAPRWGTSEYVAFVEDFGKEIEPDLVVVFLNTDDIGRSFDRKIFTSPGPDSLAIERVPRHDRGGFARRFAKAMPFYEFLLEHSHLVQLLRMSAWRLLEPPAPLRRTHPLVAMVEHTEISAIEAQRMGEALFLRLAQWCEQNGTRLLVLTTGWHGRFVIPHEPTAKFMEIAPKFFTTIGVQFADISPEVQHAMGQDFLHYIIANDGHPNERGAALIAHAAWPYLRSAMSQVETKAALGSRVLISPAAATPPPSAQPTLVHK